MSKLKKSSQRKFPLNLVATQIKSITNFDNTHPQIVQVINNNLVDAVYISDNSNVSTTAQKNVVAGSTKVFTFANGITSLYLLSNSNCNIEVVTYEADEISVENLDNTQTSIIVNSTVTSSVAVTSLPALPAGANIIGHVIVDSAPTIEITNDVGNPIPVNGTVSINPIPAGTNVIGHVVVDSIPTTPAGTNVIGHVIVDSVPTTPAGTNVIGHVIVDNDKNISTSLPTIYNVTMATANTEYSQALPANLKKINFSVQAGDNTSNYRYAYATGKVATPTAPYKQYNSDIEFSADNILIASGTLYFACSIAGKVMQIECWV